MINRGQNQVTLAGACFAAAHLLDSFNWAKTSLQLLEEWTVLDWPVWSTRKRRHDTYMAYVKDVVFQASLAKWKTQAQRHALPLKYLSLAQEPSTQVHDAFRLQLPWDTLLGHRDLLLLRCGFIMLGHLDCKPSKATVRHCIFCNKRYTSIYSHVVAAASKFRPRGPAVALKILVYCLVTRGSRTSWLSPGPFAKVRACSGVGMAIPRRHDKTCVLETGGSRRH